jgi:hypothetical protein
MTTPDAKHQAYLDRKNINPLFISIVEGLLTTEPDNHIQYIVDYLYKNYPEKLTGAKSQLVVVKDADDSDSDDDDDDDDMGELQAMPPPKVNAGRARRSSVSAESMDAKKT